ncbi:alpha-amylase A type-3 precursor, partial [Metarhizium majus ARSEF 297]
MKPSLPTTLTLLAQLAHAADTNAWKSRSIYFALTDRIARSSNDNGGDPCDNLGDYCGGTFQGLEGKLDYIRGMGFDAIWITPVVANAAGGYHGYWAQDLTT